MPMNLPDAVFKGTEINRLSGHLYEWPSPCGRVPRERLHARLGALGERHRSVVTRARKHAKLFGALNELHALQTNKTTTGSGGDRLIELNWQMFGRRC